MYTVSKLLLIIILLIPSSLWSATYYVDSTRADDSGDGLSEGAAKKTLAAATALLTANGDTLRLMKGSVWTNEVLNMVVKDNITYVTYGTGDAPIITGGYTLNPASWTGPDGNGAYVYPGTGLNFQWIYEDDHPIRKSSGSTIPEGAGYWYQDGVYGNDLYYKPTGGGNPASNGIVVKRMTGVGLNATGNAANTVIDGIHFKFMSINIPITYSVFPITIQNCQFTETWSTAIGFVNSAKTYQDVIIQDNTFTACSTNIYLAAKSSGYYTGGGIKRNTFIKSNQFVDGVTPWVVGTGDYDGMAIQAIKNFTIENNNISGSCVNSDNNSGGISIWQPAGLDLTGNVIRYNYIHDIAGTGVIWSGAGAPTLDAQIYYNIIVNATVGGFHLNKSQSSGTKSGVYNNTVANSGRGYYLGAQADYFLLKNNLISNCTYVGYLESGYNANTVLSNNLYYHPTTLKFRQGAVEKTLGEWQAIVTPQDSAPVTTNPLLVSSSDVHLQYGSPAKDVGTSVGLTTDYAGYTVPNGSAPDIGAYEYYREVGVGAGISLGSGVMFR